MLQRTVDRLRQHLSTTDDFNVTWDYFLDHLGMREPFLRLGRRRASSLLDAALARSVSQALGREVATCATGYAYVRRYRLWHGVAVVGGLLIAFVYDEVGQRGLCVFTPPGDAGTSLVRFTKVDLPDGMILGARASA